MTSLEILPSFIQPYGQISVLKYKGHTTQLSHNPLNVTFNFVVCRDKDV